MRMKDIFGEKILARRQKKLDAWFAIPSDPDAIPIVDINRLRKLAAEEVIGRDKERLESFLEKGCYRRLVRVRPKTLQKVDSLRISYPHFEPVIDYYLRIVSLNLRGKLQYLSPPPVLLNGPAGIGKTRFALSLAEALGTEYHEIPCSTVTANFVISGNARSWAESKPGKVYTSMLDGKTANPIILTDEIDKLGGDQRYDGFGPLYVLLEKSTARRFVDENFGHPMDCSHILWVGTSNNLVPIPEPILSRMRVFDVPVPSAEQMIRVIQSIYRAILNENPDWSRTFTTTLADSVVSRLGPAPPRLIKQILLEAFGNAAMRSQDRIDCALIPEDLRGVMTPNRRSIGFVQSPQTR